MEGILALCDWPGLGYAMGFGERKRPNGDREHQAGSLCLWISAIRESNFCRCRALILFRPLRLGDSSIYGEIAWLFAFATTVIETLVARTGCLTNLRLLALWMKIVCHSDIRPWPSHTSLGRATEKSFSTPGTPNLDLYRPMHSLNQRASRIHAQKSNSSHTCPALWFRAGKERHGLWLDSSF